MHTSLTFRYTRSAVSAAMIAALTLTACSPPDARETATNGGSLTVGMVGSSTDTLNPYQQEGSGSSGAIFEQMFDRLASYDPEGKLELRLAESIEANDDATVWTITLRDGVKLHNGEQFIADDVIDSLSWMIDPANAWDYATQVDFIKRPSQMEKVDDLTVRLNLDEPFGLVPEMFAFRRGFMRSIRHGATVQEPVGTGPYVIDSFTPGQEAKFTRFEDYWDGPAATEKITFAFLSDGQAVTNAMRGGQLDIASGVPFPEVPTLESDPELKIIVSDTASYAVIMMNVQHAPFDDPKVRQAVRLAVNRQLIVDNAYGGYVSIGNDYLGKTTSCPAPNVPQRQQDTELARQLIAEAGATGAKVELVTDAAFSGMMETAQLVTEDLNQIGLDASVRQLDVAAFLDRWLEWPFLIGATTGPYEVTAKGHFLPGGSENASWFDDAEYNELAAELYRTTDADRKCELITQLQTIEYERGTYLVPTFGSDITVAKQQVQGLKPDIYALTPFRLTEVTVG